MGKRKDWSLHEINIRKEELQDEIDQIENKYTQKVTKYKRRIHNTLKPVKTIRDKPIKALGVSIALGFIIGITGRNKSKSDPVPVVNNSVGSDPGFTSMLMNELKRMAARRAMIYITDLVDHKVMPEINAARTKKASAEANQEKSTT